MELFAKIASLTSQLSRQQTENFNHDLSDTSFEFPLKNGTMPRNNPERIKSPPEQETLYRPSSEVAKGIMYDWSRKNMELKNELRNIQDELQNEVSFAISDNITSVHPTLIGTHAINNPKQAVETEHQALVDIISRVKSDLVLAASLSPQS